jgi:hypothetical protein
MALAAVGRAELLPDWHGTWEGHCTSLRQSAPPQEFAMSLVVLPREGSESVTWKTTYRMDGGQDEVRDYLLLPTSTPGRFVVDERNGIQLDTFLVEDTLYQNFFLPGSGTALVARWQRQQDRLELEIPGWYVASGSTTHGPGGVSVTSFPLTSIQRCSLARAAAP